MAFIRRKQTASGIKYGVRWRDLSGRERQVTLTRHEDAKRAKREIERSLDNGEEWGHPRKRSDLSIGDLFQSYLQHKAPGLTPGTREKYRSYLAQCERYLRVRYPNGRIPCSVLSQRLVRELCEYLAQNGRHGRPRKRQTVIKIKEVFELAWQWGYEDEEFCNLVPPPRRYRELKRPPPRRPIVATEQQLRDVIDQFEPDQWQRNLVVFLAFTGLRVNQVMRLEWRDINLDEGVMHVRPELGKSRQERRGRTVPLSEHLVRELRSWVRESEFVITTRRKGERQRQARPRDVARAWKRAGVPEEIWKQRPQHAFRKAFCSILRRRGADRDAVEYLVGHDLGVRGVYIADDALPLKEAVDLFPDILTTHRRGPYQVASESSSGRKADAVDNIIPINPMISAG